MLQLIVFFMALHFIADFPFQGGWLGTQKGKSWELMFYHCAIYTGTFVVFGKVSLLFAAVLFVNHFIIDSLKARYHIIKPIWVDQLLHFIVICTCVYLDI